MKGSKSILFSLVAVVALASCSTQKNTALSRGYHSMKTRYNIYFNGNTAFEEGEKAISDANKDDYSHIIPLYPVSNHEAAAAATSQMDRTIEKSRKCIKLHSIKQKPKINQKKRSDPKYKEWLTHEEFNESMDEAWILLGKAEFHKGQFEESIGTFNYIIKHFAYDKDVVAQCQLWIVRAYAEIGWLYEAEDLLQKVNIDDLKLKHATLYAATAADLKVKTEQYSEAIPFVKLRIPDEKRAKYQPRFYYVLGQLYEATGDYPRAADAFKRVSKLQPAWEMDFNAQLHYTKLSSNRSASLKTLKKMARQYKYKDKLDQIYGTMGEIYLLNGDTAKALESFAQAIEEGTQNGPEKAAVMLRAADIYYLRHQYKEAQPLYKDASNILTTTDKDYKRVQKLAETLDALVVEYNMVELQDSLQHLATLTEEEQMKIVNQIIDDLEQQEKEEKEKAEQAERAQQNGGGGLRSVNTTNMIGGGGKSAEWYFYNPQLMRTGKQQFQEKWGRRTLEDNWRLMSKNFIGSAISTNNSSTDSISDGNSLGNDSTTQTTPLVTDQHDPQYYLQQIPKTEEDIQESNAKIATALYNMVFIYEDNIEDTEQAIATYKEFKKRFPDDERLLQIYYSLYLDALKHNDTQQQEEFKNLILAEFPDSKEATIVGDENYFGRLKKMAEEQDSIFEYTYNAYRQNDFSTVKAEKQYVEQEYPLSPLMPNFLFLNAVATAKTEGQEPFVAALKDMVEKYPEHQLSAMAKNMLTLMNQGEESQTGGNISSLADKREHADNDVDSTLVDKTFSREHQTTHYILFIAGTDETVVNNLLFEVALFNFSQFMIKDFDLKVENPASLHQDKMNKKTDIAMVQVLAFDSYEEAEWYVGLLKQDERLQQYLKNNGVETIIISEENLDLVRKKFTLEEYLKFEH